MEIVNKKARELHSRHLGGVIDMTTLSRQLPRERIIR
jgi:hypothetical protein